MPHVVSPKITALIERRKALAMSQRELDRIIGVSTCQVAKWESGHRSPTATSLERWARALGFTLELVQGDKKKRKL